MRGVHMRGCVAMGRVSCIGAICVVVRLCVAEGMHLLRKNTCEEHRGKRASALQATGTRAMESAGGRAPRDRVRESWRCVIAHVYVRGRAIHHCGTGKSSVYALLFVLEGAARSCGSEYVYYRYMAHCARAQMRAAGRFLCSRSVLSRRGAVHALCVAVRFLLTRARECCWVSSSDIRKRRGSGAADGARFPVHGRS